MDGSCYDFTSKVQCYFTYLPAWILQVIYLYYFTPYLPATSMNCEYPRQSIVPSFRLYSYTSSGKLSFYLSASGFTKLMNNLTIDIYAWTKFNRPIVFFSDYLTVSVLWLVKNAQSEWMKRFWHLIIYPYTIRNWNTKFTEDNIYFCQCWGAFFTGSL
jgi:hypothetical protein